MNHRIHRSLMTSALLAALTLPALAQPAPTAPAEGGPRKGADMRQRHEARQAQHMDALKTQLKLTPEQEPAWTAFTSAMKPANRPSPADRAAMQNLSTPERIDRMRAMRAEHAAEADRRGEATKTFYASLSAEQKKIFDAQHMNHPRREGRGSEHGPRHQGRQGGERPAS